MTIIRHSQVLLLRPRDPCFLTNCPGDLASICSHSLILQAVSKQRAFEVQQEDLRHATHLLADAELEIRVLSSQNSQAVAAAQQAEAHAYADHWSKNAARRELESLKNELIQVQTGVKDLQFRDLTALTWTTSQFEFLLLGNIIE